jgi:hypothetical protein
MPSIPKSLLVEVLGWEGPWTYGSPSFGGWGGCIQAGCVGTLIARMLACAGKMHRVLVSCDITVHKVSATPVGFPVCKRQEKTAV